MRQPGYIPGIFTSTSAPMIRLSETCLFGDDFRNSAGVKQFLAFTLLAAA